jgi:hypothetical protein
MVSLPLTNGGATQIDDADLPLVQALRLRRHPAGYAQVARASGALLHRILMNPPAGLEVDHINRDRLDNRRCNLRVVTRSVNGHNKPCSGVGFHRASNLWRARIKIKNREITRYFHTNDEACMARMRLELEHADEIGLTFDLRARYLAALGLTEPATAQA